MAESDSKQALALLGLVAAIFGVGAVLNRAPVSSRPQVDGSAPQHLESAQDIPARLWQDPLKLATEHLRSAPWSSNAKSVEQTRPEERREELQRWLMGLERDNAGAQPKSQAERKSLLLIAMIPGGSQPERTEQRLRLRQALVTALSTKLYRPVQSTAIGYLRMPVLNGATETGPNASRQMTVPFERFQTPVPVNEGDGPDRIAVLWVSDDLAGTNPVDLIWSAGRHLKCVTEAGDVRAEAVKTEAVKEDEAKTDEAKTEEVQVGEVQVGDVKVDVKVEVKVGEVKVSKAKTDEGKASEAKMVVRMAVLGPSSSDVLEQLWQASKELKEPDPRKKLLENVSIVSTQATLDNDIIAAARLGADPRPDFLKVVRTNSDDYQIACEVVRELVRRNVRLGSGEGEFGRTAGHIALLSEWDTLHGRAITRVYSRALLDSESIQEGTPKFDDRRAYRKFKSAQKQYDWIIKRNNQPEEIESFFYLRGLDGRGPSENKTPPRPPSAEGSASNAIVTEGESQADTVERLAARIAARHRELVNNGEGGFRAIGILGSDVYDKLMLLRALRPHFRGTVFFTSGMEARMTLEEESDACRNLVVGSAYGLELNRAYQQTVPPFRNHYQTALFAGALHVLKAVDLDPAKGLASDGHPRLFEIGLHGAIDLSSPEPALPRSAVATPPTDASGTNASFQLHPSRSKNFPIAFDRRDAFWNIAWALLIVAILGGLGAQIWNACLTPQALGQNRDVASQFPCHWLARRVFGLLLTGLAMLLVLAWPWLKKDGAYGEPPGLFNGASSWQSHMLFVGAIVCAIHLIRRVGLVLFENEQDLAKRYELTGTTEPRDPGYRWWRRCWSWFIMAWRPWTKLKPSAQIPLVGNAPIIAADELWTEHQRLGEGWAIVWRAVIPTALAVFLTALSFSLSPAPPLPWRSADGDPTLFLITLILAHTTTLLLLFLVTAEVLRACGFVQRLDIARTVWPKDIPKNGKPADALNDARVRVDSESADIHFIESRTRAMGRIINFPLFMMIILLVARNRYFDDWPTPIGVIVQFALIILVTTTISWLLHRSADKARQSSLARLERETEDPANTADPDLISHIKDTRLNVRKLRNGAYATFWRQPVIYGLIVGSGGFGLTALLPLLARLFE